MTMKARRFLPPFSVRGFFLNWSLLPQTCYTFWFVDGVLGNIKFSCVPDLKATKTLYNNITKTECKWLYADPKYT